MKRTRLQTPRGSLDFLKVGPTTVVTRGVVVDVPPMRMALAALKASEELNRTVVASLAEGVVVLDGEGRPLMFNDSALEILGDRPEALADVLPPSGAEHRVRHAGRWLTVRRRALDAPGGGDVCTIEDVSARVAAEDQLRAERDRAQRYLDVASTIIVVVGPDGRVQLINHMGCEVLDRAEDEIVGHDWFGLVAPERDRDEARDAFDRVMQGTLPVPERSETPVVTRSGEERVVAWRTTVLRGASGEPLGLLRSGDDVTDQRRAEAEVHHLAYHDRLTGLANRTLLEEHLALAVSRARRNGTHIALLCFDLDGFGLVNDSLGHAGGDEVLRQTARRLDDVTRANDLLARPGGDEFVVLLADLDDAAPESATIVSRLVRDALAEPFVVDGAEFHLSASIGISLFPDHADNADDLLRRADVAMEQAKRRGTGPLFYEAPRIDARTRLSIGTRLRRAVERDELVLHYQPVCAPGGEEVEGAEALVRWQDPERGLVGPIDFIPAAEETGVIDAIGEWVVDAVCRQARDWAAAGTIVPRLSFNLSPRELRRRDLASSMIERVAAYGLDPSGFCVELTESSAMAHPGRTGRLLHDLSDAGFALAIDDFGTGHSSLTRLRDLPVDVLKIDRSFLRGVPEDGEASAIVSAVVELARALGMAAVAEGVETPEQRDFLLGRGCPLAQGYLLGRPVPADELVGRLRTTRPAG